MNIISYIEQMENEKIHFLWFRISTVLNYFVHTSDSRYITKV